MAVGSFSGCGDHPDAGPVDAGTDAATSGAGAIDAGSSVTGNVSGISLAVQDSIFFTSKDADGKTLGAVVVMADKPNLATDVGSYTVTQTMAVTTSGTYATAAFSKTDATAPHHSSMKRRKGAAAWLDSPA